jgi:ubiquinone/menaquinone biosynthesis C-methylase UbiE
LRTCDILERFLPPAPATIYDIGGGTGIYALWLAQKGYDVYLMDAMPLHVEQAQEASLAQTPHILKSCTVGTATALDFADNSADAVLLFGPLYHLIERTERLKALNEAYRVLKPDGILFSAVISRFAPILEVLTDKRIDNTAFMEIAKQDLRDGQHRNNTANLNYFTTTYFHYPTEIKGEIAEAGFSSSKIMAIESVAYKLADFETYCTERLPQLLEVLRDLEEEPTLLGISPHIMGIAQK